MSEALDLYTDYLLGSFGQVPSTGLSNLLDGAVSHNKITRMLSAKEYSSQDLWREVKPLVCLYESEDACLIFDDTIINKRYTAENNMICWHWSHSECCNVKGINLMTALYHTQSATSSEALRVPVAFDCVRKTVPFVNPKTGKQKRRSPVSKNEMMRSMLQTSVEKQHLKFGYVLADSWYSGSDNMLFIHRLNKYFVMDCKCNRHCMSSAEDRNKGQWLSIDKLSLEPEKPVKVWLKGLAIAVLLCKLVFTNKDGSTGEAYLVSNDLGLSADQFKALYQKRWSVEEYHKSLKQNASLAKS